MVNIKITHSWASCCSFARSCRLPTSFSGLKTFMWLSCSAANVVCSWKIGESYSQGSTSATGGDSTGADIGGMVSIIGRQTLIYAIAETDVLEPDLHRVSITSLPDGQ